MNVDDAINQLKNLQIEAEVASQSCLTSEEIDGLRLKYLGRKSSISSLNSEMRNLAPADRKRLGMALNQTRIAIESAIAGRKEVLRASEMAATLEAERVDVTLPGRRPKTGRLHPLTQVLEETIEIFLGMGFSVAEGPVVESDWNNFEALNTPKDHPARSMHDTFYLESRGDETPLIRTHTSPMQIRVMESQRPPLYYLFPGRVARRDETTVNNLAGFSQIEGLAVDEGLSFADLRGTLEVFARSMFGENLLVRMNPSYFPFTEPSAEVFVSCFVCDRVGCPTCRGEGWIEIMGAGMVHPNVFRAVGYDPEMTGFAFGMGLERIAKLKFSVPAIRSFYENDVRFLEAF